MSKFETNLFAYQNLFFQSNEVISLVLSGKESGEVTILHNHSPIIIPLKNSVLKFQLASGKIKTFWIKKGIFSFHKNIANVMGDEIKDEKNSKKSNKK